MSLIANSWRQNSPKSAPHLWLSSLVLGLGLLACTKQAPITRAAAIPTYPGAARGPQVDVYHGTKVADPYRWMEELDNPELRTWVDAQNALAEPHLTGTASYSRLKLRLAELWSYERYEPPVQVAKRYFWLHNDGVQNQSALWVADSLEAEPILLLDPNRFRVDGTISLAAWNVSPDGKLLAYAKSDGGSDWKTWHVLDVDSAEGLADEIRFTKFTEAAWAHDSSGFYYSRYPEGKTGEGDDSQQVSVYFHRIGEKQSADQHVFSIKDHATRNPQAFVTDDGRFLVLGIFDGYAANGIYVRDLENPAGEVVRLLDRWDGLYRFIGNVGPELFFYTTNGAPRGRVIAVDFARPQPAQWRTVIPEQAEVLDQVSFVGGFFVTSSLRDARSLVKVHRLDGTLRNQVVLPGSGTAEGFEVKSDASETFFSFTDSLTPKAVYRYDVVADEVELFRRPSTKFDASPFVTEQVFYRSKDGTRVPLSITRRRDLKLDGSHPTMLYGYGGFNVALTPEFSVGVAVWLEQGGIYAVANLRGGNEYGDAWHAAGTKLEKQNVFDDFIAAAEFLIDKRYTSRSHLAISGGSNGGLLVGACMTQRPDLFAVALPQVGVLDMLRYHVASANARQWSSDYGLSEDPEQFKALMAYSPVHRVKSGVCYPATLVTTAWRDDRVVPWHSFKFGAALQHAQGCANPILTRVETRAGHGSGKPVWMMIEAWADRLAFLVRYLGLE